MNRLKPLICPQCGGKIKRDTYQCDYCETQFKKEYEFEPIHFDVLHPETHVLMAQKAMTHDLIDALGVKDASEYVIRMMADEISQQLIPLMDVKTEREFTRDCYVVKARLRVIDPTFRF